VGSRGASVASWFLTRRRSCSGHCLQRCREAVQDRVCRVGPLRCYPPSGQTSPPTGGKSARMTRKGLEARSRPSCAAECTVPIACHDVRESRRRTAPRDFDSQPTPPSGKNNAACIVRTTLSRTRLKCAFNPGEFVWIAYRDNMNMQRRGASEKRELRIFTHSDEQYCVAVPPHLTD